MKNVILDERYIKNILNVLSECNSYRIVLQGSLIKLHENANVYAYIGTSEGIPCNIYIIDSIEGMELNRKGNAEIEWIEVIKKNNSVSVSFCRRVSDKVERMAVKIGIYTPMIAVSLCETMNRLSVKENSVVIIRHEKIYDAVAQEKFQARSVINLSELDSSVMDIIYFDGADKLIEKLLYGGCRELNVFVLNVDKAVSVIKRLNKLSKKAPFSNKINVVVGEEYRPRSVARILVGQASALSFVAPCKVFYSIGYDEENHCIVTVGQNTVDAVSYFSDSSLKPYVVHYITSIMSELILSILSQKEYGGRRLYKVNAKNLTTQTIIKED